MQSACRQKIPMILGIERPGERLNNQKAARRETPGMTHDGRVEGATPDRPLQRLFLYSSLYPSFEEARRARYLMAS
jgi:hypothetical protein